MSLALVLICIDESGSFVQSVAAGSWCAVVGYTFAERRKTANLDALQRLKTTYALGKREIKLKEVSESDYFRFLGDLRRAGGALFAVATDGALADPDAVRTHRDIQAQNIRNNVPKMKFDEGKAAVATLAEEIQALSPQLYVQLVCQIELLSDLLRRGILFFVQRDPVTLRRFVWRIDQKNTEKSIFERVFEKVAPALLQSMSFENPAIFLKEADYSYFRRFEFTVEEYPKYLQELGYQPESTINIGKILREDMTFPDSKDDLSVQIADLLAAGLRSVLRGKFTDNKGAAALIGQLMVKNSKRNPPISLVHLSRAGKVTPDIAAAIAVREMQKHAQPMLC